MLTNGKWVGIGPGAGLAGGVVRVREGSEHWRSPPIRGSPCPHQLVPLKALRNKNGPGQPTAPGSSSPAGELREEAEGNVQRRQVAHPHR